MAHEIACGGDKSFGSEKLMAPTIRTHWLLFIVEKIHKRFFLPALLLILLGMNHVRAAEMEKNRGHVIYSITVDDAITPFMGSYIKSAIDVAVINKAELLLIKLDTPGGLYQTTREIVQHMLKSQVPIVVYVSPAGARAGSAGVFIALAAHIIAMAPGTNMGAAQPVDISGSDVQKDMKEKITNDAKAWARSLAETRKRNADWAEQSVVGSSSITAIKALEIGVIDLLADDVKALLAVLDNRTVFMFDKTVQLKVKEARYIEFPMTLSQKIMKSLANPNLIYILLLIGILGIFIEIQSPGLILPGLLGVCCLAVVFGVQIMPINWFGALLIFLAAAFFIAEIFITSFGILAIFGLVLLIFGSYLLFDVPGSDFFVEPVLIWLFSGGFALVLLAIGWALLKARWQRSSSNVFALVGESGRVTSTIDPPDHGLVLLHGSYWRAHASEKIDVDEMVIVKQVDSTKIIVEKKNKD